MVYDMDIHQLNLRQFRSLNFLDEIPFKNVFFCIVLVMNADIYIKKTITTILKSRRFNKWALHYFFNFLLFGNVS